MMPREFMPGPCEILGGLAGVLVPLVAFAFWAYVLIEILTREKPEYRDKIIWIIVVLLLPVIGAGIYWFARRPQRIKENGN